MKQMRDCSIYNLSEYGYMDEKLSLRISGIIDDISLLFIDKKLENLVREVNNLSVGFLQVICLEEL